MQSISILKRAWADTLIALGLSDFSPIRLLLSAIVSAAAVGLIWGLRGGAEAMTEASDIVLYGLAFFGVAFLPLFLWHLWLAPYRVMNERLNEIADRRDTPQEVDKEQTEEEAFRDLAPQIRDARDKFVVMNELTNSFFENRSAVNAVVADIGTRLKRLGIPTPEVKASDSIETVLKWWTLSLPTSLRHQQPLEFL